MDAELSSCSPSTIDSIRRTGIGRRGGVKVRGGRLPPVQIQSVISKKKSVAPKIPQRRVKVKQEESCDTDSFHQPYSNAGRKFQEGRGRGRGRASKVYIQTQGTLLGDGPALRLKKEREYANYERISTPRCSKNTGLEVKIDDSTIEDLINSYEDSGIYEDYESDLLPVKYPYIKQQIKKEIKQDLDSEETKPLIKAEREELPLSDPKISLENKYFTSCKKESLSRSFELISDAKETEEGENMMLLLQFPSCLPYEISNDTENINDKKKIASYPNSNNKEKQTQNNNKQTSLSGMPEGQIGKLQVLKSGKMRLVIGSIKISLEEGIIPEHLSEVVYMPIEKNEGDLVVLGKIGHKLVLKPDFIDVMKSNAI